MARLPVPGSDSSVWGVVLNSFLQVEHNADGSLKKGALIQQAIDDSATALTTAQNAQSTAQAAQTTANVGNAKQLQGTAISTTSPTSNQILAYDSGSSSWKPATLDQSDIDLTGIELTSHKDQPSGYAGLDGAGLVPAAHLGTGPANTSTFLRGDGTYAAPGANGESVTVSPPGDPAPAAPQQFDRWIRIEQVI